MPSIKGDQRTRANGSNSAGAWLVRQKQGYRMLRNETRSFHVRYLSLKHHRAPAGSLPQLRKKGFVPVSRRLGCCQMAAFDARPRPGAKPKAPRVCLSSLRLRPDHGSSTASAIAFCPMICSGPWGARSPIKSFCKPGECSRYIAPARCC